MDQGPQTLLARKILLKGPKGRSKNIISGCREAVTAFICTEFSSESKSWQCHCSLIQTFCFWRRKSLLYLLVKWEKSIYRRPILWPKLFLASEQMTHMFLDWWSVFVLWKKCFLRSGCLTDRHFYHSNPASCCLLCCAKSTNPWGISIHQVSSRNSICVFRLI